MAKYVLLYSGGAMAATQAERDKANQAWGAWFGKLGKSVVDSGNPFSDKVKSVASDGKVKDGPTGERANGYSIVEAATVDQAAELVSFQGSPATEPLYTVNPFLEEGLAALFVTHPPVGERVRRLRELDPDWREKLRAA